MLASVNYYQHVGCGSPAKTLRIRRPECFARVDVVGKAVLKHAPAAFAKGSALAKYSGRFLLVLSTETELAQFASYGQETRVADWTQVDRSNGRRNCVERLRGTCTSQTDMSDPQGAARTWHGPSTRRNRASSQDVLSCCSDESDGGSVTEVRHTTKPVYGQVKVSIVGNSLRTLHPEALYF